MAAGLAGIEAATNIEIEKAQTKMLMLVYGVVTFLVLLTFRSLRATLCIMIPLGLTSLLCEVLMPLLGIGVKVATLPVISVGVGIGVDYGVYIYSRLMSFTNQGMPLVEAYFNTLKTTGKAVAFTGITLAAGVCTWSFSPIKFQADMGILLSFMFLWNMSAPFACCPRSPSGYCPDREGQTGEGKNYLRRRYERNRAMKPLSSKIANCPGNILTDMGESEVNFITGAVIPIHGGIQAGI